MGPDELLLALDVKFKNDLTSGDLTKAVQWLGKKYKRKTSGCKKDFYRSKQSCEDLRMTAFSAIHKDVLSERCITCIRNRICVYTFP
ncbi:MAG: hypothetical protein ABIQ07_08005 [Ginsengibacter sp.]